jgi:hypothetical protein
MAVTGYKHLTVAETAKVLDRLKDVIEPIPTTDGTKKCRYKDGLDDASVAAELNVSKGGVYRIRNEMYGNLHKEPKERPASDGTPTREELAQGMRALYTRHEALEAKYEELLDRFNKLLTTLSLKHVADVRHLLIKEPTRAPQLPLKVVS